MTLVTDAIRSQDFYQFTSTALLISPDITYEEWSEMWATVDYTNRAINWIVGDALIYGEDRFPEKWTQVLDKRFVELHQGRAWVSRRIPPEERRESLSWSAHRETARLTPEQRKDILDQAEREGWRTEEIRDLVKRQYPKKPPKWNAAMWPRNTGEPIEQPYDVKVEEPPPPVSNGQDQSYQLRKVDAYGQPYRPDVVQAQRERVVPLRIPSSAEELFRSPAAAKEGRAAEIRAMIARLREIAAIDDFRGWMIYNVGTSGTQMAVELRKGEGELSQLSVGLGNTVVEALADAALGAMASDLSPKKEPPG